MYEQLIYWLTHFNHWHWFSFALTLFVLELLAGGGFLFWVAIAATTVACTMVGIPYLDWKWQWGLFAVFTIVSAVAWWFYLQKHPIKSELPFLNRRNAQYIGREFFLHDPIVNGQGRQPIDDSVWLISGEDLPIGTKVRVIGSDGIVLKVEKVRD